MAPMCTPEKAQEARASTTTVDDLYFIPRGTVHEESITDRSDLDDSDDDDAVSEKMDELLAKFPELEKHFDLHGQVGEGTFSTVYVAGLKNGEREERFAIKHIVPTSHPNRIRFELNCLQKVGGCDNVAGIKLCLRNRNDVLFVMPYQQHDSFQEYILGMDADETRLYMYNLLVAIARVHKFNIIHRDIKPSNFLYDRRHKKFLLVDFGLAQNQHTEISTPKSNISTQRKRTNSSPAASYDVVQQGSKRHVLHTREINITSTSKSSISANANTLAQLAKENLCKKQSDVGKEFEHDSEQQRVNITTYFQFNSSLERKEKHLKESTFAECSCYGKPKVCSVCMVKPALQASRAGTPGFRPPEVLLKYTHQTTAIDIWAAGIILLSILSKASSCFSAKDDIAALLELVTIFGHDAIAKVASKLGRHFICSEKKPALNLRKFCCTLRARGSLTPNMFTGAICNKCKQFQRICLCKNIPLDESIPDDFPASVYDLLQRLLDINPTTRITAAEALQHNFFQVFP